MPEKRDLSAKEEKGRSTDADTLPSPVRSKVRANDRLFFILAACSLIMVYVADPSMYTSTLLLASGTHDRYPWPLTLFLFIILVFLIVLIFGVVRHWRWLFWLLLIAFGCSILEIPATLFQLGGFLPAFPAVFPLWYNVYRMGIALIETGMAVGMVQIYRHAGVWGMGKRSE